MNHQMIEAEPHSDTDALAAFERMNGQLAMLVAAVEGFAARQARIERRDYSQDLAQIVERQNEMTAAISMLADRPGVKLTPDGFADSVGKAATKLRAADHTALTSAQTAMGDARAAMAGVIAGARSKEAQRDALIWVAIIATAVTGLMFALAPLLITALWPAAAEERAAAILHKNRWEAGVELMASGDPTRWRWLVDADTFQHDTAQAVANCQHRADFTSRVIRCPIGIKPAKGASARLFR